MICCLQVFTGQLTNEKQPHLSTFHLILPPLCVNYIEHVTAAKEKIFKKVVSFKSCSRIEGVMNISAINLYSTNRIQTKL